MKVYFKKRHIKKICIVILVALVLIGLLKLVSIWDAKRGSVVLETTPTIEHAENKGDGTTETLPAVTTEQAEEGTTADKMIKKIDEIKSEGTQETADNIIDKYVSELYSIQNEFEARVSSLIERARSWRQDYMEANPGVSIEEANLSCMQQFSDSASAIESDCYARVDHQMALLKSELEAFGADTSVVSTIQSIAYSSMEARKAQLVQ